ncbi:DUF2252 domain-containing protein [Rhodoblastus acidophilus]|uniref:DUF2252 domain-containing protein n=1 Tax=Candidatus Rhodoblastus alkanivorans TaxID=2954117 RepID=UPI001FAADF8B|nr:DUF2252 domain-containing protein [Candidatus Rhodoblastus alkanivorans]MCI4677964.1 DUF2252 domain-containing protein [Candidatus Rhodoblastus alkanivorans]MDI4641177.1 DUF2252 domain-containing protein [Rhodoblastus acidophilus]
MTPSLPARAERHAKGKSLRKLTPRSAHGKLVGPMDRDSNAIIEAQNASRLPALIPLRAQLMAESAFAFLRGAAAVMAQDLQWQPMVGAKAQACGDCHLMNFGAFATPEDNILFDINDFDETLAGVDFTVDVKRLAASVAVAAADKGLAKEDRHALAGAAARAYRKRMASLSHLSPLEIWHSQIDLEREARKFRNAALRRKIATLIARARGQGLDRDDNFPTLAESGAPVIHDKAPRIFHFAADSDAAKGFDPKVDLAAYRDRLTPAVRTLLDRYGLRDFVFKAVGVGSVGTYCYVGLYMSGDDEPMFLQMKEAHPSVLEALDDRLAYGGNQGQRVVEGQRMMQAASDIFLGWTENKASGRHYYVRLLKNRHLGGMSEIAEAEGLADYARLCGRTLARAHARSGDPALMAGYMGDSEAFDEAIADFALAYERQTVIDYEAWARTHPPSP